MPTTKLPKRKEKEKRRKKQLLPFKWRKQTIIHPLQAWCYSELISSLKSRLCQINNILSQTVHYTLVSTWSNSDSLNLMLARHQIRNTDSINWGKKNNWNWLHKLTIAIHQFLLHAPSQHEVGDPDCITLIQTCSVLLFPVKYRCQ